MLAGNASGPLIKVYRCVVGMLTLPPGCTLDGALDKSAADRDRDRDGPRTNPHGPAAGGHAADGQEAGPGGVDAGGDAEREPAQGGPGPRGNGKAPPGTLAGLPVGPPSLELSAAQVAYPKEQKKQT